MQLIECRNCGKISLIEFDFYVPHEPEDYIIYCPKCGADVRFEANEFFWELNMDDDYWAETGEYRQLPDDVLKSMADE